jgi:fumarylacetoacetate (FAA) hydrolase family protein|tara:strand:+ start:66 stop:338 length:273 start_codon:yes stop_codon:yes gene_type:complete
MADRVNQLDRVQSEARALFVNKNKDYGDAFATYGPVGVLVRIGDKIQRLQSIDKTGITLVVDEKLRDTLIDLHNYAAMAVMLMDEPDKKD